MPERQLSLSLFIRDGNAMRKRLIIAAVVFAVASLAWFSLGARPSFASSGAAVSENNRVTLHGNVNPRAKPEFDQGASDPSLPMNGMILLLNIDSQKQAQLDQLVAEQHDPSSANYHRWLTPAEFGQRFGRSPEEIATVKNWLTSHGFTIDSVSKSGTMINFSGTAANVDSAFKANMHDYQVNGHLRHANSINPSIPTALADVVAGPVSLTSFHRKPAHSAARALSVGGKADFYYAGGSNPGNNLPSPGNYLSPGDFAAIYDVNTIYNSMGYTGKGVTIAIVGQAPADTTMWAKFQSTYGVPYNTPNVIIAGGQAPVDDGEGDVEESDIDVEWAGAVAPGATIDFVTASVNGGGIDISAEYVVDNKLAPIMSLSYDDCESDLGTKVNQFYNQMWEQAASYGITVFVASGDNGAYDCVDESNDPISPKAVNGMASTPYNVAVGGTSLSGASQYWGTANSSSDVSVLSSIPTMPEVAWNDYSSYAPYASGGGASTYYAKPSWQVCQGVPNDGKRDLPDVSLNADPDSTAYLVYTCNDDSSVCASNSYGLWAYGGTSCATPAFAGIMALIVQSLGGESQGNANTIFYQLGKTQYAGSSTSTVFNDITSGNNGFVGSGYNNNGKTVDWNLPGYSCATGYDQVTGLGSVDATNFVMAYQAKGALAVTITPSAAASAGAMWNVDGGTWQASGATVYNLSAGSHTISFEAVSGWTIPANQTVTIVSGQTLTASGTYVVSSSSGDNKLFWAGSGAAIVWTLNGSDNYLGSVGFGPYSGWTPVSYVPAPDGTARLLWLNTSGAVIVWKLDGSGNYVSSTGFGPYSGWTPVSYVFASNGTARLLWANTNGAAIVWTLDSSGNFSSSVGFGPYSGWTPVSCVFASDGTARLLWLNTSGAALVWKLDSSNNYVSSAGFGPYSGWTPVSYVFASDGTARLLWSNTNGAAIVWTLDSSGNFSSSAGFGPYSGWTPFEFAFAADGTARLLWSTTGGSLLVWKLDSSDNYVSSNGFGPYSGWEPLDYN